MAMAVPAAPMVMSPVAMVPTMAGGWQAELCSCGGGDCAVCCAGGCCPCCLVGAIDKMVAENQVIEPCGGCGVPCFVHGALGGFIQGVGIFFLGPLSALIHFGSCYACTIRTKVRAKYNIAGGGCNDCCIHYCCGPCAVCQEYTHCKKMITGGGVAAMAVAAPMAPVAVAAPMVEA